MVADHDEKNRAITHRPLCAKKGGAYNYAVKLEVTERPRQREGMTTLKHKNRQSKYRWTTEANPPRAELVEG